MPMRNRWSSVLNPSSYQAHVNPPEQTDKTQKHNSAVDGDEAEADDGSDGPDLVTSYNKRNGLLTKSVQE